MKLGVGSFRDENDPIQEVFEGCCERSFGHSLKREGARTDAALLRTGLSVGCSFIIQECLTRLSVSPFPVSALSNAAYRYRSPCRLRLSLAQIDIDGPRVVRVRSRQPEIAKAAAMPLVG